jgi:hypothetical protein
VSTVKVLYNIIEETGKHIERMRPDMNHESYTQIKKKDE